MPYPGVMCEIVPVCPEYCDKSCIEDLSMTICRDCHAVQEVSVALALSSDEVIGTKKLNNNADFSKIK